VERARVLARFNSGALQVLFTSDAFGLGLDYSCVDVVLPIMSLAASKSAYVAR
jgi:superfamily II DNA/RNA helicase